MVLSSSFFVKSYLFLFAVYLIILLPFLTEVYKNSVLLMYLNNVQVNVNIRFCVLLLIEKTVPLVSWIESNEIIRTPGESCSSGSFLSAVPFRRGGP